MSVAAQLREMVESLVNEVTGVLHRKDKQQDARMDLIEERLGALEPSPPSAPRARRNVKAQAGTAEGSGEAPNA